MNNIITKWHLKPWLSVLLAYDIGLLGDQEMTCNICDYFQFFCRRLPCLKPSQRNIKRGREGHSCQIHQGIPYIWHENENAQT